MTDFDLQLRISVEGDQAVIQTQRVRRAVGELGSRGREAGEQLAEGMTRARRGVQSISESLERAKRQLLGFAGGLIAFRQFESTVRRVISATAEQEAAMAGVESRIRSTGGAAERTGSQLAAMAAELQRVTTYGDEAILRMQELLLTFTQVRGPVFDEATRAILNVATVMGQDLSSAALQVGKALNDPILGLTALSRSGIQFSDSQQAAIKAMVEAGNVAGAQRLILAELETQFGGAAEAARNTLGGALAALRNAFGDLLEASQEALAPAREAIEGLIAQLQRPEVVEAFGRAVRGVMEALALLARHLGTVMEILGRFGPLIAAVFGVRALRAVGLLNAGLLATVTQAGAARAALVALEAAAFRLGAALGTLAGAMVLAWGGQQVARLIGVRREYARTVRDIEARARAERAALEETVEAHREHADVQVLSAEALARLGAEERRIYAERLRGAREFARAMRDLLSRDTGPSGAVSEEAIEAQRRLRELDAALRSVEPKLAEREAAEAAHRDRLAGIKRTETEAIRDELARQLDAYEAANARLRDVREAREGIEREFQDLVDRIRRGPQREGPLDFLGVTDLQAAARQALVAGDLDRAIDLARQAGQGLEELQRAGDRNTLALAGVAEQIRAIASEAARAQEEAAEAQVQSIQATIEDLVARAEALRFIEVGFDEETAQDDAESLRRRLEELLAASPIKIPVVLETQETRGRERAEKLLEGIQGHAGGGLIRGPGSETSDSILARLSRGEYVLRAAAVRRYGVPFVEALNRLQLPRFATGGLVERLAGASPAPRPAAAAGGGTPVHLHLPGGEVFALEGEAGVVAGLTRAFGREALKRGRR